MILPFLRPPAVAVLYLQNPRERFWGVVRALDATGIVIEGVELESFDSWVGQITAGDPPAVRPHRLPSSSPDAPDGRSSTTWGAVPSVSLLNQGRLFCASPCAARGGSLGYVYTNGAVGGTR
jgi:hypothetical protein